MEIGSLVNMLLAKLTYNLEIYCLFYRNIVNT